MPFLFRFICNLLQRLEDEGHSKKKQKPSGKTIIEEWFRAHRKLLDAPDTDAAAILSTLLPQKRTDRVYAIQVQKLEGIIGRALCLGATRLNQLREYSIAGLKKDLADCVEHVLTKSVRYSVHGIFKSFRFMGLSHYRVAATNAISAKSQASRRDHRGAYR